MTEEDFDSIAVECCLDCGAEVVAYAARAFAIGSRGALCFDCAVRRGGLYDEITDRWDRDPTLDGLGIVYGD